MLIDGEEDVWANEVGFDNNLTGHLNQKAMNDAQINNADAKEIYNNEEGNINLLSQALIKGIEGKYPEVKVSKTSNADYDFQVNLRNLTNYLLETKSKIVRQENREEGVNIIMSFVYCFTKLKPENVVKNLKNNILTRDAYLELKDRINEIIMLMNKAMMKNESKTNFVNESIPYLKSVEQMFDMMGVKPNDENDFDNKETTFENKEKQMNTIKENFIRMLNKINECTYYNEKYNN